MSQAVLGLPLVHTTRGEFVENVHSGHVAVVRATGERIASYGDAQVWTPVRSTAKAVQALVAVTSGVVERYGWGERAIALLAASHTSSSEQLSVLESMMQQAQLQENQFVFRPVIPSGVRSRDQWAANGLQKRALYHVCAGKHLGMLASCKLNGWSLTGYEREDHPLQQQLVHIMATFAGIEPALLPRAIDGCGLPVFALPLSRLAQIYARLVTPAPEGSWGTPALRTAAERVTAAMNRWPELVEGDERLASFLLSDPNVVAKSGAQGLFVLALREERIAIAVKMADGSESAWPYVVAGALEQLQLAPAVVARIRERYPADIVNDCGMIVGRREHIFKMNLVEG